MHVNVYHVEAGSFKPPGPWLFSGPWSIIPQSGPLGEFRFALGAKTCNSWELQWKYRRNMNWKHVCYFAMKLQELLFSCISNVNLVNITVYIHVKIQWEYSDNTITLIEIQRKYSNVIVFSLYFHMNIHLKIQCDICHTVISLYFNKIYNGDTGE
jgi:hypothetical protein